MAFVKKIWKDRISEYPNRRTIDDGNFTKVVTVGRDEGNITQAGDAFNSSNMNDLEDRIEAGLAEKPDREEVEDMVEGFFPLDEASGAVISINPGVMLPLRSCECQINAYQEGAGDPSPINKRKIIGFNNASILISNKNLFAKENYYNLATSYDFITSANYRVKFIRLKPNTKYTISHNAGVADNSAIILLHTVPNVNASGYYDLRLASSTKTFTTGEEGYLYIGAYSSVTNLMVNSRLNLCNLQIEEGNAATSFDGNYENVIFDWGINQWNEEWEVGSLSAEGGEIDNPTQFRNVGYIAVKPSTTLFIKSPFPAGVNIYQYNSSKTYITRAFVKDTTITLESTCAYIRFRTPDTSPTVYGNDISINFPATYMTYFPYIPNNPGVVYGGRFNATAGELIVDRGIVDLGSLSYYHQTGANSDVAYTLDLSTVMVIPPTGEVADCLCSDYAVDKLNNWHNSNTLTVGFVFSNNAINICDSAFEGKTLPEIATYLKGKQLVYKLVTPLVYNLDPVVIKTLFNQNNIYHDCNGNIDVIFHKALTAKNISFDNSGTTLTATNVEDAIKEVLGRIG